MFYQILGFVVQLVEGLVAGTCLLRLLFYFQNISLNPASGNSLGPFVMAVTNWLVLPIKKIVPPIGRFDSASFLGAYIVILLKATLLWFITANSHQNFGFVVWVSIFELIKMSLTCLNGLVLIFAVMSWINPESSINYIFTRLVGPILKPIQRVLPLLGGIDLSPLVLLAMIQIALMILEGLKGQLLFMFL